MHVADACSLAIRIAEEACATADERRRDGGMSYRVLDPRTEAEVGLVVPAGDELDVTVSCAACFDTGLRFVLLDGAPSRVRCACLRGEDWRDKVAAYDDVFAVSSSPPPERPRYPDPDLPDSPDPFSEGRSQARTTDSGDDDPEASEGALSEAEQLQMLADFGSGPVGVPEPFGVQEDVAHG